MPHVAKPVVAKRNCTVIVDCVDKTFEGNRGRARLQVLKSVSLTATEGEFVAIIGPSGCGKSTLLSVIAGYSTVDSGTVIVAGKRVDKPGPDRVMVFQRPTLFPWMTAEDNIVFGLKLRVNRNRTSTVTASQRAQELLEMVGLHGFGRHYPFELSGGMQQRIEIARALAVSPQVLLMDEPFGALDALTRRSMQEELTRIHQKTGCTTLFVTHDVYEAVVLANRVFVMSAQPGEIKAVLDVDIAPDRRRDSVEALELTRHMSKLLDLTTEPVH
jgi:NitT/TauT family transport system ATP-binding protein